MIAKRWRDLNRDKVARLRRAWGRSEAGRAAKRRQKVAYRARNMAKIVEKNRQDRLRDPTKPQAREAANKALKTGALVKGVCEVCSDVQTQAHHDDYSKPLDVRWLCPPHHHAVHQAGG